MSQKTETAKRPVSRKDMTKWQWTLKEMKNNKTGYFLLAPFYIIFFIFTVLPVILSIFFSVTDFNMLETPNIVWFDNYIRLFLDDDIFILSVKNTLIFACITGPGSYLLSL
ncbi:MAG: sugar ABC transporter permease, partial [Clostridia bacterium]|nr:sugar ABC transporter permease [Clostridia bacterium]